MFVIVEYDYDVIKNSENIIEMGLGFGYFGGQVVYFGFIEKFYDSNDFIMVFYLCFVKDKVFLCVVWFVDVDNYKFKFVFKNVSGYNLKNLDVVVFLYRFVVVIGVSGFGKFILVFKILYFVIV